MLSVAVIWQDVTNPHGKKMKITCETCHTTGDWNDVPTGKFDHSQTGYQLFGEHKIAECRSCHQNLVFNYVGVACIDCHSDIHKGELGIRCENCHNSKSWENRQEIFDQHNLTNFPLIGVHANLDCESCHINEQYHQFTNTPVDCRDCHLDDYLSTLNPAHKKVGFNLDCQKCHLLNLTSWETAVYNHPQSFPLSGRHSGLECSDCHSNSIAIFSTDCYACHKNDYDQTTDPNHVVFGFSTNCETCHTGISWEGVTFDHFAESGFRIEGAHQSILCTDCHVDNQIQGLPRDCFGCHEQDFNTVSEPNHITNNFDHDCTVCHNQNRWEPAFFDHIPTHFPLTGAHTSANCVECHISGFVNTPTVCVACHETDYNNTTDPNHNGAQFSTTCEDCHTTTSWTPATWDHDGQYFPVYSGTHREKWDNCSDCHINPTNFSQFECINCHEHEKSKMDEKHKEVNSYVYESLACYNCHPTGND